MVGLTAQKKPSKSKSDDKRYVVGVDLDKNILQVAVMYNLEETIYSIS